MTSGRDMGRRVRDNKLTRTIASTQTLNLAELHTLDIFYTPIEERFERITRLAQRALRVPVAGVSLLSHEKQWFKSVAGWSVAELPIDMSLCAIAIRDEEPSIIPDMHANITVNQHPLVTDQPHFRFYAGYPLIDRNHLAIGTFCVMDTKPRHLAESDLQSLSDLAKIAQSELFAEQLTNAQAKLTAKLGASRREAMIDSLTRLWNRRGASVLLRGAIEDADEDKTDLALCLLDIDKFKQINDLHGHQIGDKALRKVAQLLIAAIRDDDIICRPGGDEFLMILTDTDKLRAEKIIERARRAVSDAVIRTRVGTIPVTVSAGYTLRKHGEDVSEDELFSRADEALMESKAAGRNRVRMAS